MTERKGSLLLELRSAERTPFEEGVDQVVIQTDKGNIFCLLHPVERFHYGVVWVGGASGGLEGPAGGLYPRLSRQLASEGVASLRLDYRHPNQLLDCILDTLAGIIYLEEIGCQKVALVGHSFGGAVVISAGVASEAVVGVAAISSQSFGTDLARELSPRALLLLHGSADEVLPDTCSREIFQRAGEPRHMILYPGCGHGLDECREQVEEDLLRWLRSLFRNSETG